MEFAELRELRWRFKATPCHCLHKRDVLVRSINELRGCHLLTGGSFGSIVEVAATAFRN